MSAKQQRAARAQAWQMAGNQKLFQQGRADLYGSWKRRLLAWLSPKTKAFYEKALGAWFRHQVKRYARQAYAYNHDPDVREMQRVSAKLRKESRK